MRRCKLGRTRSFRCARACCRVALALLVVAACDRSPTVEQARLDTLGNSCTLPEHCKTFADCPSGTLCGARVDREQLACDESTDGTLDRARADPSCILEPDGTSSSVLLRGFEVDRFEIYQLEDGSFGYDLPRHARLVICALFVCTPLIIPERESGRHVMINFDRCVASYAVGSAPKGSFDPSSEASTNTELWRAPRCPARLQDYRPRPYYSQLSVGCWAYGDSSLIAASPVLSAEQAALNVASTGDAIAGCVDQADGTDCLLPGPRLALGSCVNGSCRERCLKPVDCERRHLGEPLPEVKDAETGGSGGAASGLAGSGEAGGFHRAPCRWTCEHLPDLAIGTCKQKAT
jgi:hypothetical protein